MKNKLYFLLSLFTIGLCTWKIQAANPETTPLWMMESGIPYGYEEIFLLGELAFNVGPNAIEAGVSDNAIYIGFNQDFGNMNISVYNGMGNLVYSTVINTAVQSVVIIPFIAPAPDNYTIELSNALGSAEGGFNKN